MIRKPAFVAALTFLAVIGASTAVQAHDGQQGVALATAPGLEVPVYAAAANARPTPIEALHAANHATSVAGSVVTDTADIEVTYSNFPANAEAAFQAAVDVWKTQIVSSQVIHVTAKWTSLGNTGILGSAGPSNFYLLSDHRWYATALAEAKCGCAKDKNTAADIKASFNSDFTQWYLGTDGNTPSTKYDFETVVLHELGHGLGFLSTYTDNSGGGGFGWASGGTTYPTNFDAAEWTAATGGSLLTSFANPSNALGTQLTDGSVYFDGPNVEDVLGHRARLYAPGSWQSGSSNSHLDEATYPSSDENALMTPALSGGEVHHLPGPLTMAMFRDIGWTTPDVVTPPSEPDAPQNVSATPGNASADVAWDAPASDGGSPITGYTVTSDPDAQTCQTSGATGCTVTGLTNDTAYTFSVTATNDVGTGPASDPSAPVTPSDQIADTTPPLVGLPTATLVAGQHLGATALVLVSWPDASDISGIAGYELQVKKGSGAWTAVVLGTATDTSVAVALKPATTYRLRLRATDGAANVSAWTTSGPSTLRRLQEKAAAITYTGKWKRHALSGASGGYVRSAGAAGRVATLTFNGSSAALVSTLGPARGIVDIWLDGAYVETVDLYAPGLGAAQVVWATDPGLAAGAHTIQLRPTGTHNPSATKNRVDLDAFLVWP